MANTLAIKPNPTRDERDSLDVLATLIGAYEDQRHDVEPVKGPSLVAFLLEQNGLSQAQLACETGIAKSTLSALIKGKRPMSLSHVEALCRRFKLEPNAFIAAIDE